MQQAQQHIIAQLADFVINKRDEITREWLTAVHASKNISSSDALTRTQIIDHIPVLLLEICRRLRASETQQQSDQIADSARKHGQKRWQQGYDLDELLYEFGILRQVLSAHVAIFALQCADFNAAIELTARNIITDFITETSIDSAREYAREREREAHHYREELEQTNERLEKLNRSHQLFTRTASHELRNILSAISGAARILGNKNLDDDTRSSMLALLNRNIGDMEALLEQLLDYSKVISGKETLQITPLDLNLLFAELHLTFKPVAEAKKLQLEFNIPEDLPEIVSDQLKVKRIMSNLLSNAIKYTRQGWVKVSARHQDDKNIYIAVADSGPGIEPESLPLIFEEFHRASSSAGVRGTGLGLAITQRLLNRLNGKIDVHSELGKGTLFEVILPIDIKQESGD